MSTTITVAILVALIIGLAFGSVIAGLALMERRSTRHWVVYLRLPEDLHRRLSDGRRPARLGLKKRGAGATRNRNLLQVPTLSCSCHFPGQDRPRLRQG